MLLKYSTAIFILCILFFRNPLWGQDSDKILIQQELKDLRELLVDREYDKAIDLARLLLDNKSNHDSIYGIAHMQLGYAFLKTTQLDSSGFHLKKAIKIVEKYDNTKRYSSTINSNIGVVHQINGDLELALQYTNTALQNAVDFYGEDNDEVAQQYLALCTVYRKQGFYKKAIFNAQKANDISIENGNEKTQAEALLRLATALQLLEKYEDAIKNFEQSLALTIKTEGEYALRTSRIYTNLSVLYYYTQEFLNAVNYQKKAIDVYSKNYPKGHSVFATANYNLGIFYEAAGNNQEALEYYRLTQDDFVRFYGSTSPFVARLYNSIGSCYDSLDQIEKSLESYNSAIAIYMTVSDITTLHAEPYYNRATLYKKTKKFQLALADVNKVIEIQRELLGDSHYLVLQSRYLKTEIYLESKELSTAKKELRSIAKFLDREALNGVNFSKAKNLNLISYYYALETDFFKAKKINQPIYIDSITAAYEKAIALQDHIQKKQSISQSAKEFKLIEAYSMYEEYIAHIIENSDRIDISRAFEIAEKTKSRGLLENLTHSKAALEINLPKALVQIQDDIQIEMTLAEEYLYLEKDESKEPNDSIIIIYQNRLFSATRRRDSLTTIFKKNYPNYYNSKYNFTTATIEKIQEILGENESIIEYFVGQHDIFVFVVNKEAFFVEKVANDFKLNERVKQMRDGLYNYWALPSSSDEAYKRYKRLYEQSAHKLYQKLIAPIKDKLKGKLIIIPDGEINFIPFDALITEANMNKKSYLIQDYQTSYNYSVTSYLQLLEKELVDVKKNVIAFAPNFNDQSENNSIAYRRSGLGNLKYNIPEVEMISDLLETNLFIKDKATKSQFITSVKDYKVIHLSTHAKANDKYGDYSYIAFSKTVDSSGVLEDKLYARELYNININADMVVLSACETGIGEIKKGEGIISLARAFTYAGAQSTVTSLWNVNDAQTAKLMQLFYKNIKDGLPKDEALRKAKLYYIENEELTAPYFWAAFIPAGNMEPINFQDNTLLYVIGVGLFLLLLILFTYRKKQV